MENISQMSLLEIAVALMEQKRGQQNIRSLIKEVFEIKGIDDEDGSITTQLYIDITTSSKFVYMGNDEWDLKSRQSLEQYDKDGSAFNTKVEEEEEINELDEEDLEEDLEEDIDDEEDDDDFEDDEDEDMYINDDDFDEDDISDLDDEDDFDEDEDLERYTEDDDFDEDKYNDLMDDFEDMYEN
jgi:DNA-directed RNA polymerase subunit delta